jgi:hypothetical protein
VALSIFLLMIAYSTYFGINHAVDIASEEQEVLETGMVLIEMLKHDLRGVIASQKYPLKSDVVEVGSGTASNIEFITSSSVNRSIVGLSRVAYELKMTKGGVKILARMEATDPKVELRKKGTVFEVSRIITNFDLSFYDGTSWVDTWGESAEGKLPKQVKITVGMKDAKGKTKTLVAEEALFGGS